MTRTKENKQTKKAKEVKKTETRVAEPKVENQPKTQQEILEQLVEKVKQNLSSPDSKYVQVNENLKKVGPGLSLLGLERLYKKEDKKNFVLVPEHKVSGPSEVVEQLLTLLGSSLQQQRDKPFGVLDVNNYEEYVATHVTPNIQPPQPIVAISTDKISQIALLIKTKKTKKVERDTPKKKKAQRRKSPIGVELAKSPKISVDPLSELTLEVLQDLLKRLAEKQQGLDISKSTLTSENDKITMIGATTFKIKAGTKSKRVILDGSLRGLASDSKEQVVTLLTQLGLSEANQKTHLAKFKAAAAPKAAPKKQEAKTKTKKGAEKGAEKDKKEGKAEVTTKAKTRDVKPRTSKD